MNIHTVGTSSTTFFQKVCQLVSFTASPKQPQSVTLLVMASTSVVTVKKSIIAASSHAERRRNEPVMSSTPTTNSAHISATERKLAIGSAHSKVKLPIDHAVIYSCTLKAVPSGSTPLLKLEKRNTSPTNQRAMMLRV